MPRGYPKVGKNRGRPTGSLTKRTQEIRAKVAATGKTPLEVMLEIMWHHHAEGNLDKAISAAASVAPYMHPRLTSVENSGKGGGPMVVQVITGVRGEGRRLDVFEVITLLGS
jgi:hypothetical protein